MNAIGMLETFGLATAIEAADGMVKAAQVRLLSRTRVSAGLITVLIAGDVSAVQAAVEAGKAIASRAGGLRSAHVIPSPAAGIEALLAPPSEALPSPGITSFASAPTLSSTAGPSLPPLEQLKVTQLRSLLRKMPGRTLSPEEIKYANRVQLIEAIQNTIQKGESEHE